ncbi:hypothetical protein GALL_477980 [mine drainage metagenome]|uniref:Uncharacterized protein n=1 Tax=mine drainage metagenome TaxID=410659 RepID=A0A1J5Q3Z1_9ZZZZ
MISSEATGFMADGSALWLLINIAFGPTQGGRWGLSAGLFVLPVVLVEEIVEDTACSSGLVGTSIAVLIANVSRALPAIDGFGASTSAGKRT